ncbi:MAG: hypothetical protein AMJ56_17155, partial [Anaerolineae bacterium SG8_19]
AERENKMSIFLIIVLILLLAGAIVTYLLSGRQGKEATTGAIVVLAITLIVWILANRFIPLSFVLADWSPMESTSQWLLLVDNVNWQISFYFLLFLEALLLTQSRYGCPILWRAIIPTFNPRADGHRFTGYLVLFITWSHFLLDLTGHLLADSIVGESRSANQSQRNDYTIRIFALECRLSWVSGGYI